MTALEIIAHFVLMGRDAYRSPTDFGVAIMTRLTNEGFVIVPREPTEEMIKAGGSTFSDPEEVWAEMINAAR